jgi:hypothetical protein
MADLIPMVLLVLLAVGLSVSAGLVLLVLQSVKRNPRPQPKPAIVSPPSGSRFESASFVRRPDCWVAIKSSRVVAVQSALGLSNARPCPLSEGLAGEKRLFIAPPVKGWILVTGSGLPDPADDVDACFRFVLQLGRTFGSVQFFSVNRVLNHHAWVRVDHGKIERAYAWVGRTVWVQGERTRAERELGLESHGYGERPDDSSYGETNGLNSNADKLPLLAARWSLDPAEIDELHLDREYGIAGEPSRSY